MNSTSITPEATGCKVDDDPKARALKLFQDIDVNSDGQLNQQEFLKGSLTLPLNMVSNREGEAKFLRCSLYYEGAFSIMEPAEFSSISL